MNKLYIAVTLFLLVPLIAYKALAQVPPSLRVDYNRMMAKQSMDMQNQMSMNRMMNQRWDLGFDELMNDKYEFKVTMKDNTVKKIYSKIYADTASHKTYLLYVNKDLNRHDPNRETKVYPDQTLAIARQKADGFNIYGVATDSCWLFKVLKGKINLYSHLSEMDDFNQEAYLRAFQVGEGNIQKLDSAKLVEVIKDDAKALKAFNKKDYYSAIKKYNRD